MAKYYILYNPLAGNGKCEVHVHDLDQVLKDDELIYCNMTEIYDYSEFLSKMEADAKLLIAGGDGTLNRFINVTLGIDVPEKIYYFAAGSGNDFFNDIEEEKGTVVEISKYLHDLPIVTVKGKQYKFINGIGFGIDGYCCEEGDRQRAAGSNDINYTNIAINGLLRKFKRVNATITINGEVKEFKKVWLAPTMNGRFYGGGMMATPMQNRLCDDGSVTTMLFHGAGKLKTLMIFPSIFKGGHVKHTKHIICIKNHKVKVKFDTPTALQIDGETVLAVSEYEVDATEAARKCTELNVGVAV